jgi:hypothetical protein
MARRRGQRRCRMKPMHIQLLSDVEIEHFLSHGYVLIDDCFPREVVEEWANRALARIDYCRDTPTWEVERIHMPSMLEVRLAEFAPKLWQAVCDLLGGEARVRDALLWDSFIINFSDGAGRPWEEPSQKLRGWHKDGDHFRHFLDSPEQGLQVLAVWTDIRHRGGATFVACDSVPVVARFLAAHPEGVMPDEFNYRQLIEQCHEFVEVTARAGQVILMHPFVLHSSSQNHLGIPRVITNTPISLREPMVYDRPDLADFSPVELAVLRGLGSRRYTFRLAGERETFVPARIRQQEMMREAEKARAGEKSPAARRDGVNPGA